MVMAPLLVVNVNCACTVKGSSNDSSRSRFMVLIFVLVFFYGFSFQVPVNSDLFGAAFFPERGLSQSAAGGQPETRPNNPLPSCLAMRCELGQLALRPAP